MLFLGFWCGCFDFVFRCLGLEFVILVIQVLGFSLLIWCLMSLSCLSWYKAEFLAVCVIWDFTGWAILDVFDLMVLGLFLFARLGCLFWCFEIWFWSVFCFGEC